MPLDAWLTHCRAQPGYSIRVQRQGAVQYYVFCDEDGVICARRSVETGTHADI